VEVGGTYELNKDLKHNKSHKQKE